MRKKPVLIVLGVVAVVADFSVATAMLVGTFNWLTAPAPYSTGRDGHVAAAVSVPSTSVPTSPDPVSGASGVDGVDGSLSFEEELRATRAAVLTRGTDMAVSAD